MYVVYLNLPDCIANKIIGSSPSLSAPKNLSSVSLCARTVPFLFISLGSKIRVPTFVPVTDDSRWCPKQRKPSIEEAGGGAFGRIILKCWDQASESRKPASTRQNHVIMVVCLERPDKVNRDIQKGNARKQWCKHLTGRSTVRGLSTRTRRARLHILKNVFCHARPKKSRRSASAMVLS